MPMAAIVISDSASFKQNKCTKVKQGKHYLALCTYEHISTLGLFAANIKLFFLSINRVKNKKKENITCCIENNNLTNKHSQNLTEM